jgi:hypothetical protein
LSFIRRAAGVVALLLVGACTGEGPVSAPGTLTATLVSPNGAEGAAVIVLAGDGVTDVQPLGDTEVHSRTTGTTTWVVLLSELGGTLAFSLTVPDTTQPPTAVVQEVAGADDALRDLASGYRVEFGR